MSRKIKDAINAQMIVGQIDEKNKWKDRAYTAEVRVRALEEERQRLQADVDKLRKGLLRVFINTVEKRVEGIVASVLGHKIDCDFLLHGECTCGGTPPVGEVAQ